MLSRDLRDLEASWHQILEHSIRVVFRCHRLDFGHVVGTVARQWVLRDIRVISVDPRVALANASGVGIDLTNVRGDGVVKNVIVGGVRPGWESEEHCC